MPRPARGRGNASYLRAIPGGPRHPWAPPRKRPTQKGAARPSSGNGTTPDVRNDEERNRYYGRRPPRINPMWSYKCPIRTGYRPAPADTKPRRTTNPQIPGQLRDIPWGNPLGYLAAKGSASQPRGKRKCRPGNRKVQKPWRERGAVVGRSGSRAISFRPRSCAASGRMLLDRLATAQVEVSRLWL